jgi:anti-sigma regulatory factor (Ser/Thr protein kinase)
MRELSLNVMDIAQNSISAGAKLIRIEVMEDKADDQLNITVADDGKGMSNEQVSRVTDPFFTTRTTRKVGLGIPLFKMEAEMTGGSFSVLSQLGKGTTVTARFVPSHVDMIPLGDINSTVLLLITCNPNVDFIFHRTVNRFDFTLDTRELRKVLGDEVTLNAPDVVEWIKEFLKEQTDILLRREYI